jgi:plasmid stability protein
MDRYHIATLDDIIHAKSEECPMAAITIRNLSDETLGALEAVGQPAWPQHVEAEVRRILDEAVHPRTGLGTALARIGQELGGVHDLELKLQRDKTPTEPATFE